MDNLTNKQKSVVNFLINMGYSKSDVLTAGSKTSYDLVLSHRLLSGLRRNGGESEDGGSSRTKKNEEIMKKLMRQGYSKKEAMIATRKGKGDYQLALKYAKRVRKKKEKKDVGGDKVEEKDVNEVRERKSSKKSDGKVRERRSSKKSDEKVRERKSSSRKSKKKKESKKDGKLEAEKEKLWKEFDASKREYDMKKLSGLKKKFAEVGEDRGESFCIKQIGAIYYKNGDNEKAVKFYIEALATPYMMTKDDESVVLERSLLLYTLGLLLFKMGRKEESDQYLRQIKDKKRFMKTLKGIKKGQSIRIQKKKSKKDLKKKSSSKSKSKSKSSEPKEEKKNSKKEKKKKNKKNKKKEDEVKKEEVVVAVAVKKEEEKKEKKKEKEEEVKQKKPAPARTETLDDDVFNLSSEESSDEDLEEVKEDFTSEDDDDVFQLSDEDDEDLELYENTIMNTPIKGKVMNYELPADASSAATDSPAFDVTPYDTPTVTDVEEEEESTSTTSDTEDSSKKVDGDDDNNVSKVLYEEEEKEKKDGTVVENLLDDDSSSSSSSSNDFNEGESEEEHKSKIVGKQEEVEDDEDEVIFENKVEEEEKKKEEDHGIFMSPPKKKSEVFKVGNDQLEKESSRMEAEFFGDGDGDDDVVVDGGKSKDTPTPLDPTMEELDFDEDFDFPEETQIMSFEDHGEASPSSTGETVDLFKKKHENEEEVMKTPDESDGGDTTTSSSTEEEEEPTVNLFAKKKKKNRQTSDDPTKEEEEGEEEEAVEDIGVMDSDTEDMDPKREKKMKKKEKKRIQGTIDKRKVEFRKLQKTYTIPNYIYLRHLLDEIGELLKELEKYCEEGSKEEEMEANRLKKAQILTNLGTISFQKKNFVMSVHYFVEAVEFKKKIGDLKNLHVPLNNIGKIYFAQREYEKAYTYFEEAFGINPEYTGVLEYLSKATLKSKKFRRGKEVLELFKKKAETSLKSKNMCWAYRKLGLCLAKLGKWEESLQYFRKAVGLVEKEKDREKILANIQRLEEKIG